MDGSEFCTTELVRVPKQIGDQLVWECRVGSVGGGEYRRCHTSLSGVDAIEIDHARPRGNDDSYGRFRVKTSSGVTIGEERDAFCKEVSNSSTTLDYFVPTYSSAEWSALDTAAGTDVPDLEIFDCVVIDPVCAEFTSTYTQHPADNLTGCVEGDFGYVESTDTHWQWTCDELACSAAKHPVCATFNNGPYEDESPVVIDPPINPYEGCEDGSCEGVVTIGSCEELQLTEFESNTTYILTNDIDCSATNPDKDEDGNLDADYVASIWSKDWSELSTEVQEKLYRANNY